MVILTAVDVLATVWPVQPGAVQWRYGAWGLLSGFLLTPLLGMVMIAAASAILGHADGLKAQWWINLGMVLLLVLGSGLFVLDVVQLRGTVPPEDLSRYQAGAAKALLKHLAVAAALFVLARGCRATARRLSAGRRQSSPQGLVMS
jgi:hypothetical protein